MRKFKYSHTLTSSKCYFVAGSHRGIRCGKDHDGLSSDCLLDFPYSVKAFCLHPYLANKVNLSAEFFQVKIMKRNVLLNKCDPSLIWFLHIYSWRNTSRFSLPHMCICTVLSSSLSAQRCERQAKNVAV